jgi:hypothetical protein
MSLKIQTQITVPSAQPELLTTLAQFKDDYAVGDSISDAFIQRTIARCSSAIRRYCNRTFGPETRVDTIFLSVDPFPFQAPGMIEPLQLSRWPIVNWLPNSAASPPVPGITVSRYDGGISTALQVNQQDPTTLTSTDYVVLAPSAQLMRLNPFGQQCPWWPTVYVVQYQSGWALPGKSVAPGFDRLPDDIEDACGRLVNLRITERKRDPLIRSQSIATGGTTSYWGSGSGDGNLTEDVIDILEEYRVPVVA